MKGKSNVSRCRETFTRTERKQRLLCERTDPDSFIPRVEMLWTFDDEYFRYDVQSEGDMAIILLSQPFSGPKTGHRTLASSQKVPDPKLCLFWQLLEPFPGYHRRGFGRSIEICMHPKGLGVKQLFGTSTSPCSLAERSPGRYAPNKLVVKI